MQISRLSSLTTRFALRGSVLCKCGARGFPGERHCSSGLSGTVQKRGPGPTGGSALPSYQLSRIAQGGGALALFGAMVVVGYNALDDVLIYDNCSSKAMETASQDPRLKEVLGEDIHRGPWHWYEASLAVAREGLSASCSFPVSGSQGTGSLHLKAVRLNGTSNPMDSRGQWEVLMLEALIPSPGNDAATSKLQRINLMQTKR